MFSLSFFFSRFLNLRWRRRLLHLEDGVVVHHGDQDNHGEDGGDQDLQPLQHQGQDQVSISVKRQDWQNNSREDAV